MRRAHKRVRLLIADHQALFRRALRLLLETQPGFQVVGEASDGLEAVALTRRLKPDVLLLDLALPRLPGLDALRSIAERALPVRTILVAGWMTRGDVLTALSHGALGIVLKDASPALLFESIRTVMKGQYWIQPEVMSSLLQVAHESREKGPPAATSPPRFNLTARQLEVVQAVMEGLPNKDIAARLGVTEPTIKHHLTSIFDKMGVSNRLELAVFAMHHGLLVPHG